MYIVIIGSGKVGFHLSKALLAVGHEVLMLENNPVRCQEVREELGSVILEGDGSQIEALENAGTSRAEVLIAATAKDEDNLAACQFAKHMFNVGKTIAVINNPENEVLFKLLGIDVTVSSTQVILSHIEEELPTLPLVHLMTIKDSDKELVHIEIPPDGAVVGKAIKNISLPPGSFISLVIDQQGQPSLPTEDLVLQASDEVVAVTNPDSEESIWSVLTGVD